MFFADRARAAASHPPPRDQQFGFGLLLRVSVCSVSEHKHLHTHTQTPSHIHTHSASAGVERRGVRGCGRYCHVPTVRTVPVVDIMRVQWAALPPTQTEKQLAGLTDILGHRSQQGGYGLCPILPDAGLCQFLSALMHVTGRVHNRDHVHCMVID